MRNILISCFFILLAIPALADGNQPLEALQRGVEAGFRVLKDPEDEATIAVVKKEVEELCSNFPLYDF